MTETGVGERRQSWMARLAKASRDTRSAPPPTSLDRVLHALRLLWATEGAIESADPGDELWWLRIAEAVATAADRIEAIPEADRAPLSTGPIPGIRLTDTPDLRQLASDLIKAAYETLRRYALAAPSWSGGVAAAAAADSLTQALPPASP